MSAVSLHYTCKGPKHGNNNRFKLSSVLRPRTLLWACGPLVCVYGQDVACMCCLCAPYTCVHVYGSVHVCRMLALGRIPERCLHFRALIGTASFCSSPCHVLTQLKALLGHRSSSTSTSTSKSADPQQQYYHLECVACSSPCSLGPS